MIRSTRYLLALLIGIAAFGTMRAQLPQQLPYQGLLSLPAEKSAGKAELTLPAQFTIWDAAEGGKMLWEESYPSVAFSRNGDEGYLFNVLLGSVKPIPLKEKRGYWLEAIVDGDTLERASIGAIDRQRQTDPTLTQKFESQFGYSVMLPAAAKFNTLGSAVNLPGETEKQNWLLSGGKGSIMIYYIKEGRMIPRNFQLLDSVHYYNHDSLGRNGMIHRRVYILKDYSIQIDVLLTEKGQQEYADKVTPLFDSFIPPPNAIKTVEAWRYGRNAKEFEKGRYREFGGPGR